MSSDKVSLAAERFYCPLNEYKSKSFSIPLTFRKDKEKGGTFLVRVGDDSGKATTDYRLIQVTNLSLTVKKSDGNILVWVTAIDSGKPVEGVDIYCEAGNKDRFRYSLGKTDKDGVLFVKRSKDYKCVTVEADGDEAIMTMDTPGEGIIIAQTDNDYAWFPMSKDVIDIPSGVQPNNRSGQDIQGKAFTDRGIISLVIKLTSKQFCGIFLLQILFLSYLWKRFLK